MRDTMGRRYGDRLLWSVVAVSAVITALTVIGTKLIPPSGPGRGFRPPPGSLPRMRPSPESGGDLLRALGIGSLTWYACVLSAPLFIWLSRRLPLDRERWRSSLAVHLLVIVALVLATATVQYRLGYGESPLAPRLSTYLQVALLTGTLPFLVVAAAAQALEARTRAYDRELDAARVRGELAEAKLEALTAQLQPHFLFNTLQGISTLITHDPIAADRMLASLSDLLREVLRRGDTREVEVSEELRVLGPYLEIARSRFGQRLSVTIDVDADAAGALVPFFILQPLVENAVQHGIGSKAGAGTVAIRGWRDGPWLRLSVTDDGPGIAASGNGGRGIGLANTRARLHGLYGDRHELDLGPLDSGGLRVTLAIPFRVRDT
jgi:two-component system LytT family sensor kinase